MVWLKRTDTRALPVRVKIIKSAGGGDLIDHQLWMRAGNTHNGDLLLASVVGAVAGLGTGIWHVPKANLPPANLATPMPADLGKVLQDTAVLFPVMAGTKGVVVLGNAQNYKLYGLYGDDGLTWYWIGKAGVAIPDPADGIYVRERGLGQPRP